MVNETDQTVSMMQFGVRHLFFVFTLIAVFLVFRQWGVSLRNEGIVVLGEMSVCAASSVYVAMHRSKYAHVFLIAALTSFVCVSSWAIERVYCSAGTSFLRTPPSLSAALTMDPELNMILVAFQTIAMTLIGGSIGSLCKYLWSWKSA
jgi:hypothetical protein